MKPFGLVVSQFEIGGFDFMVEIMNTSTFSHEREYLCPSHVTHELCVGKLCITMTYTEHKDSVYE